MRVFFCGNIGKDGKVTTGYKLQHGLKFKFSRDRRATIVASFCIEREIKPFEFFPPFHVQKGPLCF